MYTIDPTGRLLPDQHQLSRDAAGRHELNTALRDQKRRRATGHSHSNGSRRPSKLCSSPAETLKKNPNPLGPSGLLIQKGGLKAA